MSPGYTRNNMKDKDDASLDKASMNFSTVFVFDVDGVLCNLGSPEIDGRMIEWIARLLREGYFVAINTGRGYDRVGPELVKPLLERFDGLTLKKLFVSTEMGGEATTFDGSRETRATGYKISTEQIARARQLFEDNQKVLDTMYWYKAKKSMATSVMIPGSDRMRYKLQQQKFVSLLKDMYEGEDIRVGTTQASVEVHAPDAGKQAGAHIIYEWLGRVSDLKHDDFICFGDSHNDYEMARYFADKNLRTRFVYTGAGLEIDDLHDNIELIDTAELYVDGATAYLSEQFGTE